MTKFFVDFDIDTNEPAVIMKDGEGYAFDGNVERAKEFAEWFLHSGLPYEERFEHYQAGSIYGGAYSWIGDTENPEDMKKLQQILDDYNG